MDNVTTVLLKALASVAGSSEAGKGSAPVEEADDSTEISATADQRAKTIVEEYVNEVLAERLIFYTENVVKKLGSLEVACDILGIEISDYMKAKELLQKTLA